MKKFYTQNYKLNYFILYTYLIKLLYSPEKGTRRSIDGIISPKVQNYEEVLKTRQSKNFFMLL